MISHPANFASPTSPLPAWVRKISFLLCKHFLFWRNSGPSLQKPWCLLRIPSSLPIDPKRMQPWKPVAATPEIWCAFSWRSAPETLLRVTSKHTMSTPRRTLRNPWNRLQWLPKHAGSTFQTCRGALQIRCRTFKNVAGSIQTHYEHPQNMLWVPSKQASIIPVADPPPPRWGYFPDRWGHRWGGKRTPFCWLLYAAYYSMQCRGITYS